MCAVVEELKPDVVSFHFGLPDADLVKRQKTSGRKVILPQPLPKLSFSKRAAVTR
jgi:NAD(P)H-dependent flavin oxidoreductase YrpB (nitropropane dioxygenase family)